MRDQLNIELVRTGDKAFKHGLLIASQFDLHKTVYHCMRSDLDGPLITDKRNNRIEKYLSGTSQKQNIVFTCGLRMDGESIWMDDIRLAETALTEKESLIESVNCASFYGIRENGKIKILCLFLTTTGKYHRINGHYPAVEVISREA